MAAILRGSTDEAVGSLRAALDQYEAAYPGSVASLYRQNVASIRVRVLDARFEGMAKSRRHAEVWNFLAARVPAEIMAEISVVLALPPAELGASLANLDFENPLPSQL